MPLCHGKNAFKLPEKRFYWYNNPTDANALNRVYPDVLSAPYYEYPVLVRNLNGELVCATDYEIHIRFQSEFIVLMEHLRNLCIKFDLDLIRTNDYESYDVIDRFSINLLCGFTGTTSSRYAHQADPAFFAEIKLNCEIIVNEMLKDIDHAKSLLMRLIEALNVCEGGAWAELKIISHELNPKAGLFDALHHIHLLQVNEIARLHVLNHKSYFDRFPGKETHVNVFMQYLFYMLRKIEKPLIRDVYLPVLSRGWIFSTGIYFQSRQEIEIAKNYKLVPDDLARFESQFNEMCTAKSDIENLSNHLDEQVVICFRKYEKTITEALQNTYLSPDEYMATLEDNEQSLVRQSLVDAKALFLQEVNNVFRSFGVENEVYYLMVNEPFSDKKSIKLKSHFERLKGCYAIASYATWKNEAINGFSVIHLSNEFQFIKEGEFEFIVDKEKSFLSPLCFLKNVETLPDALIDNASLQMILALKKAINIYRSVYLIDDAFEESLPKINQRLRQEKQKYNVNARPLEVDYLVDNEDDVMDIFQLGELKSFCKKPSNFELIREYIRQGKLKDIAFLNEVLEIADNKEVEHNGASIIYWVRDLLNEFFSYFLPGYYATPTKQLINEVMGRDVATHIDWYVHVNRRNINGKSPLTIALERNDAREITRLLSCPGIGLSLLQHGMISSLIEHAFKRNQVHLNIITRLIMNRPDDNICDYMTHMQVAHYVFFLIKTKQIDYLGYMARYVPNINFRYLRVIDGREYFYPLIFIAAIEGWGEVVDVCLKREDLNFNFGYRPAYKCPLMFAAKYGLVSFAKKLKETKKYYLNEETALDVAIEHKQYECISFFLKDNPKSFNLNNYLSVRFWQGDDSLLAHLIKCNVSYECIIYCHDRKNMDALRWAIHRSYEKTTKEIVAAIKKNDPDAVFYLAAVFTELAVPNPFAKLLLDYAYLMSSASLDKLFDRYGFSYICKFAGKSSKSNEAVKLWAKICALRIEHELSIYEIWYSKTASQEKVKSIYTAIEKDDVKSIVEALKPQRSVYSFMWYQEPSGLLHMPQELRDYIVKMNSDSATVQRVNV